jgi:hypothetical protein
MVIRSEEPNIASVIHAEIGIFIEEDNLLVLLLSGGGGGGGDCSVISIIYFRLISSKITILNVCVLIASNEYMFLIHPSSNTR